MEKRIASICTQFQDIKYLASCALLSYIRSLVLLVKTLVNKVNNSQKIPIFIDELNISKLSMSWGLADIPIPVKQFISTLKAKFNPSTTTQLGSSPLTITVESNKTDSEDDEQLLVPKKSPSIINHSPHIETFNKDPKKNKKKVKINELGHASENISKRMTFDDEGNSSSSYRFISENGIDTSSNAISGNVQKRAFQLELVDDRDRALQKEKKREKKRKLKSKKSKVSESFGVQLETEPSPPTDLESMALSALGHYSK